MEIRRDISEHWSQAKEKERTVSETGRRREVQRIRATALSPANVHKARKYRITQQGCHSSVSRALPSRCRAVALLLPARLLALREKGGGSR